MNIVKFFIYQLFKIIYGKVIFSNKNDKDVKFIEISKDNLKYKFAEIYNGRIFTDYVENVAIINKNQILDHVSYQQIDGELKEPVLNVVVKKDVPVNVVMVCINARNIGVSTEEFKPYAVTEETKKEKR